MSGKVIYFATVWSCLAHVEWQWIVPQRVNWWRGEILEGGKVQPSTSLSCLKEMRVGSAGEAWRLMSQKGALTAFPLVAVLLGGPIGLGCHFCYLILCMWTRLIHMGWGWGKLSAEQQQERRAEENSRMSLRQLQAAHFSVYFVQVKEKKPQNCNSSSFWFSVRICSSAWWTCMILLFRVAALIENVDQSLLALTWSTGVQESVI